MATRGGITLSREVEVVRIPSGEKIVLPAGTEVVVTQSLGGSHTLLVPSQAGLFRLDGRDADAIGREKAECPASGQATGSVDEKRVWEELKTCYDPEIPVNIVDLGLIYELKVNAHPDGGSVVEVKMTLTAPGCGMGPVIASDARRKILALPGVAEANVEVVWDPPWTPDRISPDGKQKLGIA